MTVNSKRVTITDVAKRAGVDRSVVSRLLNEDPKLRVRPETRARVFKAIEDLDYRPNSAARSLRLARSFAYGLLIPNFDNPVYTRIIAGAEEAAEVLEAVLLVGSLDAAAGNVRFLDLLGQGRVDGLLYVGTDGSSLPQSDNTIPSLEVNRRSKLSERFVILDDEQAASMAVEHLLGLSHVKIGHIAGPATADTARRRRQGYEAGLSRAGVSGQKSWQVSSDYTPAGGYQAMTELLDRQLGLTAIFVANVASAIGALAAARERHIDVPRDLSVIAVHDHDLADYLQPPLTTVRMPVRELGARAVRVLAETPPDTPIHEVVSGPMELVIRESTSSTHPGA